MRPGAAEVDVEGVAVAGGGEGGVGGAGDGGAEGAGFAAKLAVGVGVGVNGGLRGGVSGCWWVGAERTDFFWHFCGRDWVCLREIQSDCRVIRRSCRDRYVSKVRLHALTRLTNVRIAGCIC